MNPRRRRFLVAGSLAPLAWAAACSAPPPVTRVGASMWVGYGPLFLARELGFYDPASLRLVEMPSNSSSLMALSTGDLEAAALTLDECLLAREGGLDVRALLVFDYSAGADVVMARPEIQTLGDLRGKRIGVEETAAGALMFAKLLEEAGADPADVSKIRLTADRQVRAYQANEVDVLISWEPIATQLEAFGAHRLYDSAAFPGLIVDVLAARSEALDRVPAHFGALLAGYFRALDHLSEAPDDAYRRMAPRLGMQPDVVQAAHRGVHFIDRATNRTWLAGKAPTLMRSAATVGRVMLDAGLLNWPPVLDDLVDPRFLPEGPG